jgi:ferredoxin
MKTTLYYFTGSGNSLVNARRIAEGLEKHEEEVRIVSIPGALEAGGAHLQGLGSHRVGFLFPTYAYGLPRIVKEFVQKVEIPGDAYLFAVASNFGIPGPVLRQLDGLLRKKGSRLHAGFSVLDARSSLMEDPESDPIQKVMISANRGKFPERSIDRIDEIVATIVAERRHPLESSTLLANLIGGMLNPLASRTLKSMAENFWTNDACSSCGTCARICPRGNIRMENGRPVWGDDCEMCHACIQWCPREAVQFKDVTSDKPRYRNPEVAVGELVIRK